MKFIFMSLFICTSSFASSLLGDYKLIDGTEKKVDGEVYSCSKKISIIKIKDSFKMVHHDSEKNFPTLFDYKFSQLKEGCHKTKISLEGMLGRWKTCKTSRNSSLRVKIKGINPGFDAFYGKDIHRLSLDSDILTVKHTHLRETNFSCTYERI